MHVQKDSCVVIEEYSIIQAFSTLQLVLGPCCGGRTSPSCGVFENGILLMCMLEGISSVANFITAYEESQ